MAEACPRAINARLAELFTSCGLPADSFRQDKHPENRAAWFSNGGFLRDAEVEIMRQPKAGYATKHIRAREGLDRSYCVYSKERFLGVALYDDKKRIYTADKVLCR